MSASLRSLSDQDVLSRTRELVVHEREITLLVLLHLNEIERRGLHLKHAYQSMFGYCTSGLGYSASAASRRIRTARCIARFPEVYALLESNEVNLSTISQISKILTPDNRTEVLRRISGKSQKEVEGVVAECEPRAAFPPDRVRPVVVLMTRGTDQKAAANALALRDTETRAALDESDKKDTDKLYDRCGCDSDSMTASAGAARMERRVLIQFSASKEFMSKVDRVRSIAWHRLPANASLEQVFELALDLFIDKESHEARHDRRQAKASTTKAESEPPRSGDRYIPPAIRDEIFARDQGQCTYADAGGRRCASRRALQIDHVHPVALGGASTRDNLRLLCAYHNRSEAERLIGLRE